MSVLECERNGCKNVMCDRLSHTYGYLCNECFDELCGSDLEIEDFLKTRKQDLKRKIRRNLLEEEYKIRGI
jgi:hypothetical protein